MSGIIGDNIKLSIFGESHGKAIGITIDGLPAGIELNMDYIYKEIKRRAPGQDKLSTSRREEDEFEILSGYFNNKTTGTPMAIIIKNKDYNSKDYKDMEYIMRPGHGDYPGYIKYNGFNDYNGGGHFSGRITAGLNLAGAICKNILEDIGIYIGSHIKSIKGIEDKDIDYCNIDKKILIDIRDKDFPVIDENIGEKMKDKILKSREDKDSIGGIVETAILNLNPGIGDPFFNSIESNISKMMFSIPAIKGIEFGAGFDLANMYGSQSNDEYFIENDKIRTYSNHSGGINGGISNGMPIVFRVAIKPTSSIGKRQRTVRITEDRLEETDLIIKGRHDPCIVPRALPVIENATAIVILDLIMNNNIYREKIYE